MNKLFIILIKIDVSYIIMLEFTTLDFVLISCICYLCGLGTGLSLCAKYKETFLRSISNEDLTDLSRYNHQTYMPPPETIIGAVPTAPTSEVLRIEIPK